MLLIRYTDEAGAEGGTRDATTGDCQIAWPAIGRGSRSEVERFQHVRRHAGVVQVLLGVRRGHLLGEDLQAIAIRVEEIDALGETVVGSELDPRAVALEPIVKLPKLLLAPFDLEGRVGQTGASPGLVVRDLYDRDA